MTVTDNLIGAQTLQRAAEKLREAAAKATPGPWENFSTDEDGIRPLWVNGPAEDPDDVHTVREVVYFTDEMAEAIADIAEPSGIVAQADLDWMALASPVIAEPLAVWLESVAVFWPEHQVVTATAAAVRERSHALLIARAVLGES